MAGTSDSVREVYELFYEIVERQLRLSAKQVEQWRQDSRPNNDHMIKLVHAVQAFLTEIYPILVEDSRRAAGARSILISPNWVSLQRALPLLTLYTDQLVVMSGTAMRADAPDPRGEGVWLHDMPLWLRDVLRLKPAVTSGDVVCIPRNYFNGYPGMQRAAWIMAEFKFREESGAANTVHAESVFGELVTAGMLGAMVSRVEEPLGYSRQVAATSGAQVALRLLAEFDLPFLRNVDVATVCKLKRDYGDSFAAFRRELQHRIQLSQAFDPEARIEDLKKNIEQEWIQDGIARLESDLRREGQRRWATAAGVVLASGSLAVSAMTASPWPAIVAAGSAAVLELARSLLERGAGEPTSDPLYGLWRLKAMSSPGAPARRLPTKRVRES
jgi:hypothetical protein